jgi:predicted RNA binding protein YcfA (HicA-like mRNA interferase family)
MGKLRLPRLSGYELFKIVVSEFGFVVTVQRPGSHVKLRHDDGRRVTISLHGNKELPIGTLTHIIHDELQVTTKGFIKRCGFK